MRALLIVLGLTTACFAQLTPEEAVKELERRKAEQDAARAQIVQITAGELADLRLELASLKRQVGDLQSQLAVARGDASAPAADARPAVDPVILKAIRDCEVVVGMTLEQAERALGTKGLKLSIDEEGQRVQWTITRATESARQTQTIDAWFKDGKLSRSTFHTSRPQTIERREIGVGTVSTDKKGNRYR